MDFARACIKIIGRLYKDIISLATGCTLSLAAYIRTDQAAEMLWDAGLLARGSQSKGNQLVSEEGGCYHHKRC